MDGRDDTVQGFHFLSTVVLSPKALQINQPKMTVTSNANSHVSIMAGPLKEIVGHYIVKIHRSGKGMSVL